MLDDLLWFCDSYIFYLTSRTLSFVQFDQIYQFAVSPLSHFDFDHEGAVPINFNPWFNFIKKNLTFLSQNLFVFFVLMFFWIDHTFGLFSDPKSISRFNFFLWLHVIPNWSHISQRRENVCTLKWLPKLWAPLYPIYQIFRINGL